ncbi:MAG: hypothetical protein ACI3VO_13595, partial [Intestinibacter sp.]
TSMKTRVLRFVIGIITLGAVYALLKYLSVMIFGNNTSEPILWIVDYIRYTLIALWGVAGVPFLFKVCNLD